MSRKTVEQQAMGKKTHRFYMIFFSLTDLFS